MYMATLFMMVGPPSSGKTTWARDFYNNYAGVEFVYVSRDEIRLDLVAPEAHLFSREEEVLADFCYTIAMWLNVGHNVIADATHINYVHRAEVINYLKKKNIDFDIIFVVMQTPYNVCVERDNLKEGREHVTADIIWDYFTVFIPPTKDEFDNVKGVWYIQ